MINNTTIKQVSETKFLGVIIDEKLNWEAHTKYLTKKLASATGMLNRIKDNIPTHLHASLYHTLFESHLSYGITVWGGISNNKLLSIFRVQKRCLRILFGDREEYLDKFKTCARTRPFTEQILGSEFFEKEHTKPIFSTNKFLTIHNLHSYHCCMDILKFLKFRIPISLYSLFTFSKRKPTLIITPQPTQHFVYSSGITWNAIRSPIGITDISDTKLGSFKQKLKSFIINLQNLGDKDEWELGNMRVSGTTITNLKHELSRC